MSGIEIADFADTIMAELDAYERLVEEDIEDAINDTTQETVKALKESSPKGKTRKKGNYAKGWTSKVTGKGKGSYSRTVYAGKGAPLTHLLEYGHALRRGGREIGKAEARPHIAAAEQQAVSMFREKIEEKLQR